MAKPVLIIDLTAPDALRKSEFVTPLQKAFPKARVVHYTKINPQTIQDSSGIILSGTTLLDHAYALHVQQFAWLKKYEKPVLGICAGQQVLVAVFGGKILRNKIPQIGLTPITIDQTDSLLDGYHLTFNAYMLHQSTVTLPPEFISLAHSTNEKNVIIRHEKKALYGVSFHPEVRNEKIFQNFCSLIQSSTARD